jgi:hypothetical protein
MPPTKGTEAKPKKSANWKDAFNSKLLSLLHPHGPINPNDHSATNIKRVYQEWPNNKIYRSFATLIHGKLEKICAGKAINGAREVHERLEGEYH